MPSDFWASANTSGYKNYLFIDLCLPLFLPCTCLSTQKPLHCIAFMQIALPHWPIWNCLWPSIACDVETRFGCGCSNKESSNVNLNLNLIQYKIHNCYQNKKWLMLKSLKKQKKELSPDLCFSLSSSAGDAAITDICRIPHSSPLSHEHVALIATSAWT